MWLAAVNAEHTARGETVRNKLGPVFTLHSGGDCSPQGQPGKMYELVA